MEGEEDVQRGRLPIKSFAEITSCHTIHISENFPCYRGDDGDNGVTPANEKVTLNGNKGIKRERGKSAVIKGFKQGTVCVLSTHLSGFTNLFHRSWYPVSFRCSS